MPLHPRTTKMLKHFRYEDLLKGLIVIEPVGFLDMVSLEKNAKLIATDSGGIQKEAYFHRVPCVTLRDETEWVETLEAKWNVVVGADSIQAITDAVRDSINFSGVRVSIAEYGEGKASQHIVRAIGNYFSDRTEDN